MGASKHLKWLFLLGLMLPMQGQSFFCTQLENDTWSDLVDVIRDSFRLVVLCPFKISGEACPSEEEYPEGLVFEDTEFIIIECDPNLGDRDQEDVNTECVINCPGRHFTVRSSSSGLILTNMVLSGATNTSIYVEPNGSLEVVNTFFYNNSALNSDGGAVVASDQSDVQLEFNTFTANEGIHGGAIFTDGGSVRIKQSRFFDNEAIAAGGAIAIKAGSLVDVRESLFSSNQASSGGALYSAGFSQTEISGSTFENNFAEFGGAIYNSGKLGVEQSILMENYALEEGGAINVDLGSTTTMLQNSLVNNGSGKYGPAVYDRFNTGITRQGNEACGNDLVAGGASAVGRTIQCNGIIASAGRRRVICLPFQETCVAPTLSPTLLPTSLPSFSISPSLAPINAPSSSPSKLPSIVPSLSPSLLPSLAPSSEISGAPSESPTLPANSTSSIAPTEQPSVKQSYSLLPSSGPSLTPSDSALNPSNSLETLTPSTIDEIRNGEISNPDAPSLGPSPSTQSIPSFIPTATPEPDPRSSSPTGSVENSSITPSQESDSPTTGPTVSTFSLPGSWPSPKAIGLDGTNDTLLMPPSTQPSGWPSLQISSVPSQQATLSHWPSSSPTEGNLSVLD